MKTNDSKTSVDSKLEEMEEKYPVEQIAVKNEKKITAKDVKEAVKEINPDTDSLGTYFNLLKRIIIKIYSIIFAVAVVINRGIKIGKSSKLNNKDV